jgi:hypothetical protein
MKSPEMERTLNEFAKTLFGRGRSESMENKSCVCCGGDASTFNDALSQREYEISGMCQKCQNKVFK